MGVGLGLFIVIAIGGGLLGAFYSLSNDIFSNIEDIWEGVFCLLASIIIGLMGAALLRINKIREKVKAKIMRALDEKTFSSRLPVGAKLKLWIEKNMMMLLPLVTVLREGLEAIAFIGGVGLSYPAAAFPIPIITGLLAGIAVGFAIYKLV
jgi:high-affinity iron transporter